MKTHDFSYNNSEKVTAAADGATAFDDSSYSAALGRSLRLVLSALTLMALGFGMSSTGWLRARSVTADSVTIEVGDGGYYANIRSFFNTSGIKSSVSATDGGALAASSDYVEIRTNASDGYKFYISAKDNNLYLNGQPTSDPRKILRPVDAKMTNAAPLAPNTWGFAVSSNTAGLTANLFDSKYHEPPTNPGKQFTPNKNSKWAAIPTRIDTPVQKFSRSGVHGDGIAIYYGFRADNAIESGDYKGNITYTVIADGGASTGATITPRRITGGSSKRIKISAPLYTNYQLSNSDFTITVGGAVCSDANVEQNDSQRLVVSCLAPSKPTGTYDVNVAVPKFAEPIIMRNALSYD